MFGESAEDASLCWIYAYINAVYASIIIVQRTKSTYVFQRRKEQLPGRNICNNARGNRGQILGQSETTIGAIGNKHRGNFRNIGAKYREQNRAHRYCPVPPSFSRMSGAKILRVKSNKYGGCTPEAKAAGQHSARTGRKHEQSPRTNGELHPRRSDPVHS